MKFWLITWTCYQKNWNQAGGRWTYHNDVISEKEDGTPARWLLDLKKRWEDAHYEDPTLINTLEITGEEYEQLDGIVG